MPLGQDMTSKEMQEYLLRDLLKSVKDDIRPCIRIHSKAGGYFAVPRLVLAYIDYLGILYRAGHRTFLKNIFGRIDPNYDTYGDLLWEIYRNGLMHSYEPKTVKSSGRLISWTCYKGKRTDRIFFQNLHPLNVTHLVPHKLSELQWIQPISIVCLYQDLISAIREYASLIEENHHLEENFKNAANKLQEPLLINKRLW